MRSGLEVHRIAGHVGIALLAATALAGCGADGDRTEEATERAVHALNAAAGDGPGWTGAASMRIHRKAHTATLLPSGRVLIAGGASNSFLAVSDAEEYDPAEDTWTPVGPMLSRRAYHTATLLDDGRVLVAGGYQGGQESAEMAPTDSVEVYDPADRTFEAMAPMSRPRGHHTATLLPGGRVLVTGGAHATASYTDTAEIYDPEDDTWTTVGSMTEQRGAHVAIDLLRDGCAARGLNDGCVLVAGGWNGAVIVSTAEIFDPLMGVFMPASNMATGRHRIDAVRLADGRVLVSDHGHQWAEIYDPTSDQWSQTELMGRPNRARLTLLPSGRVLATGGYNSEAPNLESTEIYDPDTNTWLSAGSMADGRDQHTATLLQDGRVLVTGGRDGDPFSAAAFASAELFREKLGGEACAAEGECRTGRCEEGACTACRSVQDCASGLACDLSGRCGPRVEDSIESGCSAARPGRGAAPRWAAGLGLALIAAIARRRNRAARPLCSVKCRIAQGARSCTVTER